MPYTGFADHNIQPIRLSIGNTTNTKISYLKDDVNQQIAQGADYVFASSKMKITCRIYDQLIFDPASLHVISKAKGFGAGTVLVGQEIKRQMTFGEYTDRTRVCFQVPCAN